MPKPEDVINLIKFGVTLKRVTRAGWELAGVNNIRSESVAEHAYGTIVSSIFISQYLLMEGTQLNIEKVTIMAAIHDLAESLTSDSPHSLVNEDADFRLVKQKLEDTAIQEIFSKSRLSSDYFFNLWKEYSMLSSIEARIVRGADIIEMLIHALSLEDSGVSPKILHQFFASSQIALSTLGMKIFDDIYSNLFIKHKQNAKNLNIKLDN